MPVNSLILENLNVASAFVPVSLDAGANTGDWIDVSQYERCAVVFFKAAGTAGDDPTLTIQQATAAAGTGAKALNFTTIYTKQGTLTSVGQFTTVTQASGNTYTDATSAEVQAIWVVEFKGSDFDDGFNYLQASVADVGTNAQIGCALYLLDTPKYAETVADVPSPLD